MPRVAMHSLKAMFLFFSSRKGCLGSLVISIAGSLLLFLLLRACNGGF